MIKIAFTIFIYFHGGVPFFGGGVFYSWPRSKPESEVLRRPLLEKAAFALLRLASWLRGNPRLEVFRNN